MKILIVNYHHFLYGGPDRYYFNIQRELRENGHGVVPFSFNYEETDPVPFVEYFPEPITGPGPCIHHKQELSLKGRLKAAGRLFYNPGVDKRFRKIMRIEKPDLVYSIYLAYTFLPNLACIAKKEFGIPFVYRLSDFHMFCPSYLFYRNGSICTECFNNGTWAAVKFRCMQDSFSASLLRALQIKHNHSRGWYDHVDRFVCPSQFMALTLEKSRIKPDRILHLPTCSVDMIEKSKKTESSNGSKSLGSLKKSINSIGGTEPFWLYLGRVIEEKGADALIEAYNQLPLPQPKLRLVGPIEPGYQSHLTDLLDDEHQRYVEFTGPLSGNELTDTLQRSRFVVLPARWFENMPNAIVEALSAGKAVIASDLGSLPELVKDGDNGLLVPPGDVPALARALVELDHHPELADMGKRSRVFYLENHTPEKHLGRLLGLFGELVGKGEDERGKREAQ
jgi:glycosyltransferase involved in cell wall biosynthesis